MMQDMMSTPAAYGARLHMPLLGMSSMLAQGHSASTTGRLATASPAAHRSKTTFAGMDSLIMSIGIFGRWVMGHIGPLTGIILPRVSETLRVHPCLLMWKMNLSITFMETGLRTEARGLPSHTLAGLGWPPRGLSHDGVDGLSSR